MTRKTVPAAGAMEPINLKFKLADAEQVTAAMVTAVESDFGLDEVLRHQAREITRSIHLALSKLGCVIIQLDNDATNQPGNGRAG